MTRQILTHPGEPHLDELVASALVLAFDDEVTLLRRDNPVESDFEDKNTWVLDQGSKLEPEKYNFDHHQLAFGVEECTISLIADHFKIRSYLEKIPWFKQLVLLDSLGPYKAAEIQDCDPRIVQAVYTPFAEFFLYQFKDVKTITDKDPLFKNIRLMGKNIMAYYYKEKARLEFLRERCEIVNKDGIDIIYFMVDVDEPFMGMHTYALENKIKGGIAVIKDERNDGWSLRRLFEDPKINFTKIDGDSRVIFAHSSGFIAKIKKIEKPEIEELIFKSVVD